MQQFSIYLQQLHFIDLVDILLVWWIFYRFMLSIRGTLAMHVLRSIGPFLALAVLAYVFQLYLLLWLLDRILPVFLIAMVVLFQPELRRALAVVSRERKWHGMEAGRTQVMDEIVKACFQLSERQIGAIIAIERAADLGSYISTGILLDARVTSGLIVSIFHTSSSLHDGGVIISKNRILGSGAIFPLSQDEQISKRFGTRHRAAMGLTEATDAVVITVSEETGAVSFVLSGQVLYDVKEHSLRNLLIQQSHGKGMDSVDELDKEVVIEV